MKVLMLLSVSALMLSTAGAFAADATTGATMTKATTSKAAPAKVRSAKSLKCSADADAKGLHGKERKSFRKHCMKSPS